MSGSSSNIAPIRMDRRVISMAMRYVENPALVDKERDVAVPLLIRALGMKEMEHRQDVMMILCTVAMEELWQPLCRIMADRSEPDELRDHSAVYISLVGPFISRPAHLNRILQDLFLSGDHGLKVRALLSMGWEGNRHAIPLLMSAVRSDDQEIRDVAIDALCSVREPELMDILEEMVVNGSDQERLVILFNLWQFQDSEDRVAAIYTRELRSSDPPLRADILRLLGELSPRPENRSLYQQYLEDPDGKIRGLALERLFELDLLDRDQVREFLDDPCMDVKRRALAILREMDR